MRFCWPLVAALAACYAPAVHPGAPCGPNGECPSGLDCIRGTCLAPGTNLDDAAQGDANAQTDGMIDAAIDGAASVPWGAPVAVPSLNAVSGFGEDDPTFTSNRLTVIETSNSPTDLYECTRPSLSAAFTCTALTVLNSTSGEASPEISPDGSTLYFKSARSGTSAVYMSTKSSNGIWGAPVIVMQLSDTGMGDDLAISPDGLTAVVGVNASSNHILLHTRASTAVPFGAGVPHIELEITADIAAPTISNGGATIYFHAGGTRDIYVAHRMTNGNYTTPVPVTELNTAGRDAAPFVSADDKYMIFERDGDMFETSRP